MFTIFVNLKFSCSKNKYQAVFLKHFRCTSLFNSDSVKKRYDIYAFNCVLFILSVIRKVVQSRNHEVQCRIKFDALSEDEMVTHIRIRNEENETSCKNEDFVWKNENNIIIIEVNQIQNVKYDSANFVVNLVDKDQTRSITTDEVGKKHSNYKIVGLFDNSISCILGCFA